MCAPLEAKRTTNPLVTSLKIRVSGVGVLVLFLHALCSRGVTIASKGVVDENRKLGSSEDPTRIPKLWYQLWMACNHTIAIASQKLFLHCPDEMQQFGRSHRTV